MREPTFTPGEWWLGEAGGMGWVVLTEDGGTLASIPRAYPPDSDEDEERKANARLFTASKDLYEALSAALEFGGHADSCPPGPCECWRRDAAAALRKARGR